MGDLNSEDYDKSWVFNDAFDGFCSIRLCDDCKHCVSRNKQDVIIDDPFCYKEYTEEIATCDIDGKKIQTDMGACKHFEWFEPITTVFEEV